MGAVLVLAPSEHEIVGPQRFGRARARGFDLGAADMRNEGGDDLCREVGLHGEYILDPTVIALRPEVRARLGFDQLGGDPQPVADPARTALDHIAGPELGADRAHVASGCPVGEGRVAGDDEEFVVARKVGDDVLGQAVAEVVLRRVAAQVVEGQDRDRRTLLARATAGA